MTTLNCSSHAAKCAVLVRIATILFLSILAVLSVGHAQNNDGIEPLPEVSGEIAGSIPGRFSVGTMGAANYDIEIEVPPGMGTMQPNLSINYSGTQGDGLLATGWNLSGLSSITRCPSTMAQDGVIDSVDYDQNDRFCLDGQRLVVISGQYGASGSEYRTEIESFSKIIANGQSGSGPESFTVWTKDGQRIEYGTTTESRIIGNPNNNSVGYWMTSSIHDRFQKGIEITYLQDGGVNSTEKLPTRIDYTTTSPGTSSAFNSVRFVYEDRPYPRVTSGIGPSASARKRLARIETYTQDTKAWEYRFTYNISPLARTDRLETIARCDAQGVCLPATQLEWGADGAGINQFVPYPELNDFGSNEWTVYHEQPTAVGDWDGDGRTDIARAYRYGIRFYRSTGQGFQYIGEISDLGSEQGGQGPLYVGDWDGDGRSDIARVSEHGMKFYLRPGSGAQLMTVNHDLLRYIWRQDQFIVFPIIIGDWNGDGRSDIARGTEWGFEFYTSTGSSMELLTFIGDLSIRQGTPPVVGDWNGDGMSDFARMDLQGYIHPFVSTGHEFNSLPPVQLSGAPSGGWSLYEQQLFSGDWNGDGLADLGLVSGNDYVVSFSQGSAMTDCNSFDCLHTTSLASGWSLTQFPALIGDWNNDGISDFARFDGARMHFVTLKGNQFSEDLPFSGLSINDVATYPILMGDWNGDGIPDIGRVREHSVQFFVRNPSASLLLTGIRTGSGEETFLEYKPLTDNAVYLKGSGAAFPTVDAQPALPVISKVKVRNSLGTYSDTTYRYSGLRIDRNGRGVSGFDSVSTTDVQTGVVTTTTYHQNYPFKGIPHISEQRLNSGVLITRKTDTWSTLSLSSNRQFLFVAQSVAESYELDGSAVKSTSTETSYDEYGNIVRHSVVASDGLSQLTVNSYDNDASSWIIGQLRRTEVTKATGHQDQPSITHTSAFEYDPATGNLRTEIIEPDYPQFRVAKNYGYDVFGNVVLTTTQVAGAEPRSENVQYDVRGQFAVRKVNAAGHAEIREYDPRFGTVTRVVGPNGIISQMVYDSFGRTFRDLHADGTERRTVYLKVEPGTVENASFMMRTDLSGLPPTITYFDHLGRELRQQTVGFDGRTVLIDRLYDERGNVTHISEPYFENDAPQWTIIEYDIAGRPTRVIAPGNRQSTTQYLGLTTIMTNAAGQTTTQVVDSNGKPILVIDALSQPLTYLYDAYGNPTEIVDPRGNRTLMTYDLRGQKIGLQDPASGRTNYEYDGYGQLLSETNANDDTVLYQYDHIGRLIKRTSREGIERWKYDSGATAIGKLSDIFGLDGFSEHYDYNQYGRVSTVTRQIHGVAYQTLQKYDSYGRPSIYAYPSGFQLQNLYNSRGFLTAVKGLDDGKVYWEAAQTNARGQLELQKFGNGLETRKSYDSISDTLASIQTTGNQAQSVQDLHFQFDSIGNLIQRSDQRIGTVENFSYDRLNRLTRSHVVGQTPVDVAYDGLGNITSKSDIGEYHYDASRPHAVASIIGMKPNTYQYDPVGNRIRSSTGSVRYNSLGKPISIVDRANEQRFFIDPSGQRYEEQTYGSGKLKERKVYGAPLFERIEAHGATRDVHYIQGGDGVVAVVTLQRAIAAIVSSTNLLKAVLEPSAFADATKSVLYLHSDHLGSIQSITDATGAIAEISSYDSWGVKRNALTWEPATAILQSKIDRGFTGHEQLDPVGLIHMNGRLYDPLIGRFLSADPFVQSPGDLQSLNRYSYVNNNPLSLTDPSGFFFKRLFKRIASFVRKALPVVASIVVAYWTAGLANGLLLCNTAFSGLAPSLATSISAGVGGFSGSVAGTLASGGSPGEALHAGLRGFVMAGLQGGLDFEIDRAFPSWSRNVTGATGFTSGNLQIVRPSDAVATQLFRMGARASERAAISHLFGGNGVNGFVGSLSSDSFAWGVNILSEQAMTSQINGAHEHLKGQDRFLSNEGQIRALARDLSPTFSTAGKRGLADGLKDSWNIAVLDSNMNNHGVAGSTSFWTGEAGLPNRLSLMEAIGMYVPGQQSVSIAHDFLVGSFQIAIGGPGTLTSTYSSLTIPPAVLAVQWANGYKFEHSKLRMANR